jgi:hypothetical protein
MSACRPARYVGEQAIPGRAPLDAFAACSSESTPRVVLPFPMDTVGGRGKIFAPYYTTVQYSDSTYVVPHGQTATVSACLKEKDATSTRSTHAFPRGSPATSP